MFTFAPAAQRLHLQACVIVAAIVATPVAASDTLSSDVWTGRILSDSSQHCGFSLRPAKGFFRNDIFELQYKDGVSVERKFAARIDIEGHFTSHKSIPSIWVGWGTGARKDTTVEGQFQNGSFTGKLAPTSSGLGCSATIILFPGKNHKKKDWATLVSERDNQRVLQMTTQDSQASTTVSSIGEPKDARVKEDVDEAPVPVGAMTELTKKLSVLKNLIDEGVITEVEATGKRQALLDAF